VSPFSPPRAGFFCGLPSLAATLLAVAARRQKALPALFCALPSLAATPAGPSLRDVKNRS